MPILMKMCQEKKQKLKIYTSLLKKNNYKLLSIWYNNHSNQLVLPWNTWWENYKECFKSLFIYSFIIETARDNCIRYHLLSVSWKGKQLMTMNDWKQARPLSLFVHHRLKRDEWSKSCKIHILEDGDEFFASLLRSRRASPKMLKKHSLTLIGVYIAWKF